MSTGIKIKKGLSIKLKGRAQLNLSSINRSKIFAINPPNFHGITPKMALRVGDKVQAGDTVFFAKNNDKMKFVSPVSGEIKDIVRGAKRKILSVKILANQEDSFRDFGVQSIDKLSTQEVKDLLLEAGCWPFIKQRPYDVVASPEDTPKAIFISAYATAPLAASHEFALKGKEKDFQAGVDTLTKLTEGKVHLSFNGDSASFFNTVKGVEIHQVTGKHPAGNVGVQISKIDPINSGDRVWVVNPQDVAAIGSLLLNGKFDPQRVVALAGSRVKNPQYYSVTLGAQVADLVADKLLEGNHRIISGNPLTGETVTLQDPIGYYDDLVSVIPEGNQYRFLGWLPFVGNDRFSMSRTSLSFLKANKEFDLDTNLNGEERAFVVTGSMEKVMPIDIYPMQLLKATMVEDIEKMENYGIYEVAPEDFGLIDFISPSKIEAQEIIRKGLDLMIKEVG